MLTVKLLQAEAVKDFLGFPQPAETSNKQPEVRWHHRSKIVEAKFVNIEYHRMDELASVEGEYADGQPFHFYVTKYKSEAPSGIDPASHFYYKAYIENEKGRTVETVGFMSEADALEERRAYRRIG